MVDVPKSIKTKKRIRSLFSPEQSKLIRTKALPTSSSSKQVKLKEKDKSVVPKQKKHSSDDSGETYRFEVDLTSCDRDSDKYPEISFSDLLEAEENSEKEDSDHEDSALKKMSEYFEKKYSGGKSGRRRITDVQIDHGYDTSDPFVDDSEAFDEVIPDELDTQHGGFYINFGDLMFKKVTLSDSDEESKKTQNKKRKRVEEDRKQLHKKMKTMKIKEKYKKIEKDVKLKKKQIIEEDDSDECVKPVEKPAVKETENKQTDKKQAEKSSSAKDTSKPSKSSEGKVKKPDKKVSGPGEKRVTKKKSKDILEEERRKVLEIVERNKPFGEDNFYLITNHLASIEFELRRNHSHSRRVFYEDLIQKMGAGCEVEYTKLKDFAFGALLKENAVALEEALTPLKEAVAETMSNLQQTYSTKRAAYLEKMESWKLAQAELKEGEELAKPKAPQKHFKWDDRSREAYGKVLQVKFSQLKLLRAKTEEQYDLMKRYMKTLLEDVWSPGWISTNILMRESQPYCKLFSQNKVQKKKPSVPVHPLKTNPVKPAKLKFEPSSRKDSKQITAKSTPANSPKTSSVKSDTTRSETPKSASSVAPSNGSVTSSKETLASSKQSVMSSKQSVTSSKQSVTSSKETVASSKETLASSKQSVTSSKETLASSKQSVTSSKETVASSKETLASSKQSVTSSKQSVMSSKETVMSSKEAGTLPKQYVASSKQSVTSSKQSVSSSKETVMSSNNNSSSKPSDSVNKTNPEKGSAKPPPVNKPNTGSKTGSKTHSSNTGSKTHSSNTGSKTHSSKFALSGPSKNFSADIAIIKNNISKISANLNKTLPSLFIPENQTKSMSPPTASAPSKTALLKLNPVRPQPKSGKTAADRPVVSVPSMSHLITPRTAAPPVKFNNEHIPPDFINNLLKKYGPERLQQIKSQGLFPVLLKEELQQVKSNNNAVIIIDDDVTKTMTSSPRTVASSPKQTAPIRTAPSKPNTAVTSKISVIEKASPSIINSKRPMSTCVTSTTPSRQTFSSSVTTPKKIAHQGAFSVAGLTNSRPSILITKTTSLAPKSNSTSTLEAHVSTPNLQNILSKLMSSSSSVLRNPAQNPAVIPGSPAITISRGNSNSGGISFGTILSQHPQIDTQTLKSVAAKLQSFKESKEKE